jgi:endonuclease I
MVWRLVTALAVLGSGWCGVIAAPPTGYYASAEGKAGADLRRALHVILTNATVIPYSSTGLDTSDALRVLDEDPANTNNVILIYARRSEPKSTFALTTGWNREHLWPNSYGIDSREPAYSDLHNLRAADATVNSARGNKFYDRSDTNSPGYKVPGHAEAPLTSTDSDSWEPPDVVKGDIARAVLYMMVRYTGDRTNEPALFLTDATAQVNSVTNCMARLTTLLRWHLADPPDESERRRNDLVFERYQHNRNPFVDRPEWVAPAFWPVLTVTTLTNGVRLQWPGEYTTATVEASTTLAGWGPVTNAPTLTGGTWMLTVPKTGAGRFYRLRLE